MYPGSFAPQILQALKDSIDAKAGGVNERTSRIRGVVLGFPFGTQQVVVSAGRVVVKSTFSGFEVLVLLLGSEQHDWMVVSDF